MNPKLYYLPVVIGFIGVLKSTYDLGYLKSSCLYYKSEKKTYEEMNKFCEKAYKIGPARDRCEVQNILYYSKLYSNLSNMEKGK